MSKPTKAPRQLEFNWTPHVESNIVLMRTGYLFADPSFIGGWGRIFDFAGTLNYYNVSPNPEIADARALWSDWRALGDDISSVIAYAQSQKERREWVGKP